MRMVRSSQLPPARSARAFNAGPRSMLTTLTSRTASDTATTITMVRA